MRIHLNYSRSQHLARRNRNNRLLVVVFGLPGAGKTTVAQMLSEKLRAGYIATDDIWRLLYPEPKYTQSESQAIFLELAALVERKLRSYHGATVVEGVFASVSRLHELQKISERCSAQFTTIQVRASIDVLLSRISNRRNLISAEKIEWLDERFEGQDIGDFILRTDKLSLSELSSEVIQIANRLSI